MPTPMPNTNDTVTKLQDLLIERVYEADWSGARTLLDAIIAVDTSVTVGSSSSESPPVVDPTPQVPGSAPANPPEKSDNPNEDSEWQRRFGG